MTDVNALGTLREEHAMLSKRAQESKREADNIRAGLQESQGLLNHADEELQLAQRTVGELEERQRKLNSQLENARHQLNQRQIKLQEAHQSTATFAQQLGPASQKQKRFEEALLVVEQNLRAINISPPPSKIPQSSPDSASRPSQPLNAGSAIGSPHPAPSEAQRAPRADMRIELSFQLDLTEESAHNFYTGFTDNISEGGIFIATQHLLDIGTQIKFPLSLPGMEVPELVEGTVKWVRREEYIAHQTPTGLGIQFNWISNDLKRRIDDYIQRRESIFYDD
jgi:uncharacterized protein (TIGR02266 family)